MTRTVRIWLAFRRGSAVLAVPIVVGLAVCVSGCWSGPGTERAAPVRPASPDQAKTDELIRLNANLASDPALASEYQAINTQYFDGRLPGVRIRWEPRLAEVGPLIAENFRLEGATNGQVILLNPSLERDDEGFRRTLVHEMVHVATRDQDQEHGPVFQSRLRQLSEQGAFVGKVATEEEKQEMRRTIEGAVKDLEKAEVALRQTRAQLDADTTRVQAQPNDPGARAAVADLPNRIDFYNSDVQRFNADAARLNRMIEEYNLMIAYPDGLDRERLSQRGTLAGAR
jgi:hypothetical protein